MKREVRDGVKREERKKVRFITVVLITVAVSLSLGFIFSLTAKAQSFTVKVDNQIISFPDAKPFIDSANRTQVPVRFVSNSLGATVDWNGDTKTVIIKKAADTYTLTIGEYVIKKNGTVFTTMDTASQLVNERTFVPARFVAETLSAKVNWDGINKIVNISTSAAETTTINGFVVPTHPDMAYDTNGEKQTMFSMRVDRSDSEYNAAMQQIQDAFCCKFSKGFVDNVIAKARTKRKILDKDLDETFSENGNTIKLSSDYNGIFFIVTMK